MSSVEVSDGLAYINAVQRRRGRFLVAKSQTTPPNTPSRHLVRNTMAKAKGNDKKAAASAKGKGGKADKEEKQVKGAQSINVRHILVRTLLAYGQR